MAKKEKLITFLVDEELLEQLEDARWEARLSRAQYMREAIREKLGREGGEG